MQRVTGIGGIFFTAKDPSALRDWYKRHLDFDMQDWGGTYFTWTDSAGQPTGGSTVWSVMDEKESFGTGAAPLHDQLSRGRSGRAAGGIACRGLRSGREDREFGIRQVRLGHRSRRQQRGAVGTSGGLLIPSKAIYNYLYVVAKE